MGLTRRTVGVVVWALFALSTSSCLESSNGWRSLDSLAELQETFNGDVGHHRIVLLLSPT